MTLFDQLLIECRINAAAQAADHILHMRTTEFPTYALIQLIAESGERVETQVWKPVDEQGSLIVQSSTLDETP